MDKITYLIATILMPMYLTGLCITSHCEDNTISLIDTKTWTVTNTIEVGLNPRDLLYDQKYNRVFISNIGDDTITCIHLSDLSMETIALISEPRGMAFSDEKNSLYIVLKNENMISVMNAETFAEENQHVVGNSPRNIILGNGDFFVSNNADHTISTSNSTIQAPAQPYGLCINDSALFVTSISQNCITVYNLQTRQEIASIKVASHPTALVLHPNKPLLYCTSLDEDKICVINLQNYMVQKEIPVGKNPFGMAISPDGHFLTVTNNGDHTLSVIDTELHTVIHTLPIGRDPHGVLWLDIPKPVQKSVLVYKIDQ